MIDLRDNQIDAAAALGRFETEAAKNQQTGAIVSFTGQVRGCARTGRVRSLFLQAYSPMTEQGIEQAVRQAEARWPLQAVHILHRTGLMAPGDTIVFVATASAHRRAAFEAADYLMDYLKTEAIFWKREDTITGSKWIEPRPQDHLDAARWTTGRLENAGTG